MIPHPIDTYLRRLDRELRDMQKKPKSGAKPCSKSKKPS